VAEAIGQTADGWLIIPFFLEGGRYTIHDVHYVAEGADLVPAGQTEFARDKAFGYQASDLRAWVAEKTAGRVPADQVTSITIADIREGGPEQVAQKLMDLRDGRVCVINAASMKDMQVFVLGLLQAEAQGKNFIYRTAASFVQTRIGLAPKPILTRTDLSLTADGGGLIVVGSYVPRSTAQVEALLAAGIVSVEIDAAALLGDGQKAEIMRVASAADDALQANQDVAIFTSRQLITGADAEKSLAIGRRVSDSLVEIVLAVSTRPRYLLAKGGITSSDVATQGLGVKRAMVVGQILPGVPVWELGLESRYPGMPYIVFPGNVGGPDAMAEVVTGLKAD
jgi:uncharacterized protein YgbK (DUF1537 family)